MNKLSFSEVMNILLISVIIILIFKFSSHAHSEPAKEKNKEQAPPEPGQNVHGEITKIDKAIFQLPQPHLSGKISVEETMKNRRSRRDYKNVPLDGQDLSQILWAAYGITKPIEEPAFLRGGLRTAPSAGARYPLDIYVIVGNVTKLKPGIYKFEPKGHQLVKINDKDIRADLCKAALDQLMVKDAPASLVYTATFERNTSKYGERGRERYVCMDLGHSAENVYLQVEALGLGTCAIGAFTDAKVSSLLQLTDHEEPLYIMPVGHYNEE